MSAGVRLAAVTDGLGGPWALPDVASGPLSIGRKANCQLVLPEAHAYVSGEHCRILAVEKNGTRCMVLEDLSGNGTYVNGNKVGRSNSCTISAGDQISLAKPTRKGGAVMFRVEAVDLSVAAELAGAFPPPMPVPRVSAPPQAMDLSMPAAPAEAMPPPAPVSRVSAPAQQEPPSALAEGLSISSRKKQEECSRLELRVEAERHRCATLEAELQEEKRQLEFERRKQDLVMKKAESKVQAAAARAGSTDALLRENTRRASDCEELRESLRKLAAEHVPLERAQLAASEAAKHERRECTRLRAELEEEQRCAERAAQEATVLRNEVDEASGRTLELEAEVKREADFNASLEEQAAAACAEWNRSRAAVSLARKRLEDRGAQLSSLRTAMHQYHTKVSQRLSTLERSLQEVPAASQGEPADLSQGTQPAAPMPAMGVAGRSPSGMEDGTPTQDADAAAGAGAAAAVGRATAEPQNSQGSESGGGSQAKRARIAGGRF